MNFSGKKGGERACGSLLRGRTGHRVARLNDSIFVMGGADREGQWVSELHRINSENCRIDSLILDTVLPLEGFSFFSLREALLVWGGRSYTEVPSFPLSTPINSTTSTAPASCPYASMAKSRPPAPTTSRSPSEGNILSFSAATTPPPFSTTGTYSTPKPMSGLSSAPACPCPTAAGDR